RVDVIVIKQKLYAKVSCVRLCIELDIYRIQLLFSSVINKNYLWVYFSLPVSVACTICLNEVDYSTFIQFAVFDEPCFYNALGYIFRLGGKHCRVADLCLTINSSKGKTRSTNLAFRVTGIGLHRVYHIQCYYCNKRISIQTADIEIAGRG